MRVSFTTCFISLKKNTTELIFPKWLYCFSQATKKNLQKCGIQELYLLRAEDKLHVSKSYYGNISMVKNATELNICTAE